MTALLCTLCSIALALVGPDAPTHCEVSEFAPGIAEEDLFGRAIAQNGEWLAIGDNGGGFVGGVSIFRGAPGNWVFQERIEDPDPQFVESNAFGRSVAFHEDWLLVGSPGRDLTDFRTGAVHTYRFDGSSWSAGEILLPDDAGFNHSFGRCIDLANGILVAGAPGARVDDDGAVGAAYVYGIEGDSWNELCRLDNPHPDAFDLFGFSVAIDGTTIVAGSHGQNMFLGSAFVFSGSGGSWRQIAELEPDASPSYFGISVDIGSDTIVVGAENELDQAGVVYIYRFDGQWTFEAKLSAAEPSGPFPLLGDEVVVSTNGTRVLAGAPLDEADGNGSGSVHLFQRSSVGRWSEVAKITSSVAEPGSQFGGQIAWSGRTAFVAALAGLPGRVFELAGLEQADCDENGVSDSCDVLVDGAIDANGDLIPDQCQATGDFDGDGFVDVDDLLRLISRWGPCNVECPTCVEDLDGNCNVDSIDLGILLSNWSQ